MKRQLSMELLGDIVGTLIIFIALPVVIWFWGVALGIAQ